MKIGVAGTGAVGGYFGGLLKKSGNDVVFFARGNNFLSLQEKGLTIESETGNFNVDGVFSDKYDSFSDIELLLFCVKSTATIEVATNVLPYLKKDCLILTLQNGVDNEEILAATFGKHRILSAATYIQAIVNEPGVVKQPLFDNLFMKIIFKLETQFSCNEYRLFTDSNGCSKQTLIIKNGTNRRFNNCG